MTKPEDAPQNQNMYDKTSRKVLNEKNGTHNISSNRINKDAAVFVFEVRQWMNCPRQLFFKNRPSSKQKEKDEERSSFLYQTDPIRYFEKEILQEVCFELPALVLESVDKNETDFVNKIKLKNKIESLIDECQKCHLPAEAESAEKEVEEAVLKIKSYTGDLIENISKTIEMYGFELFETAADPFEEEKLHSFSKINLYGAPKKVLVVNEKTAPYMIRAAKPPKNGVWESDRIAAAAYALILENEFGKKAVSENAVIDYLGEFRVLRVRSSDKKKVFRAVRKIKDIKNGKMPNERNIRLCEKCLFKEMCRPKAKTIFSRIFGEKE